MTALAKAHALSRLIDEPDGRAAPASAVRQRIGAGHLRDSSTYRRQRWTERRVEVERSWECIFDRSLFSKTDQWQATAHEVRAADVVEAVRIE